jgi:hypothetical protein
VLAVSTTSQEQAQAEMWERVGGGEEDGRAVSPPTARQIDALARALLDRLHIPWPGSRQEASELIERLRSDSR